MIKFEIYLLKTYKHSANMMKKTVKGNYITNDVISGWLLIDNVKVAELKEVHSVEFLINGYNNIININPNGKVKGTNIEYGKEV